MLLCFYVYARLNLSVFITPLTDRRVTCIQKHRISYRWVPTTCNGRSRELVINVLSMIHTNFWNVSLRVD